MEGPVGPIGPVSEIGVVFCHPTVVFIFEGTQMTSNTPPLKSIETTCTYPVDVEVELST